MFKNYLILSRHVKELKEILTGCLITEAYTQEKNILILRLIKNGKESFLEISVEQNFPYMVLKSGLKKARKNSINFFKEDLPFFIQDVYIANGDRIIKFTSKMISILFLIRGKDTNVLLSVDNNIKDYFKTIPSYKLSELNQELNGISYTPYYSPPPETNRKEEFNSPTELKNVFPFINKIFYQQLELYYQSENISLFKKVLSIIDRIYNDKIVIAENPHSRELKLVPEAFLTSDYIALKSYETVNEALLFYIGRQHFNKNFQSSYTKVTRYLTKELETLSNRINSLKKRIESGSKEDDYYKYGNLLLLNVGKFKKGIDQITIEDIYSNNEEITISLKKNLSITENADYYFNKAKDEKTNYERSKILYDKAVRNYSRFLLLKERIISVENMNDLKNIMNELNINQNPKTSESDDLSKKFKHYLVDNKYHVYAGKDSKTNDMLTLKFAKQNDYWFHARSVSGSHVVLRVENTKEAIPKSVLKKAASIAAYHSKAKTSGTAPVTYTLKKYVIKRKGLDVGQVSLLKEEVLLVKPEIPDGCEFID